MKYVLLVRLQVGKYQYCYMHLNEAEVLLISVYHSQCYLKCPLLAAFASVQILNKTVLCLSAKRASTNFRETDNEHFHSFSADC